jgi:uncharacterized membrane-anchored protein YjiN (DUF445 family)
MLTFGLFLMVFCFFLCVLHVVVRQLVQNTVQESIKFLKEKRCSDCRLAKVAKELLEMLNAGNDIKKLIDFLDADPVTFCFSHPVLRRMHPERFLNIL